jgi:N-acetylglucosaminyldiphosphoundecaprenol N-acetyl-beta-D-mannosaminyltransferase
MAISGNNTDILGVRVDSPGYAEAVKLITGWAKEGRQGYVCAADVRTVMESYDSAELKKVVNGALLVTPDDLRLVWGLRLMGVKGVARVAVPRLVMGLVEAAAADGIPVGFHGGSALALEKITVSLKERFPSLDIAFSFTPPRRALLPHEDEAVCDWLNASGTRLLFVGLGSPEEGRWMAEHSEKVQALMFGAGDTFGLPGRDEREGWLSPSALVQNIFCGRPPLPEYRQVFHNPRFMFHFSFQLLKKTLPVSKILPLE